MESIADTGSQKTAEEVSAIPQGNSSGSPLIKTCSAPEQELLPVKAGETNKLCLAS